MNLRKISNTRITNFQKTTGLTINMKKLSHMVVNKNTLDLTKAKNFIDRMVAERITIDPMCCSKGEKAQIAKLNSAFGNVSKLQQGALFLHNGKLYDQDAVPKGVRTDLDVIIDEPKYKIVLTLKTTQTNSFGGGGSQSNSFDQVIDLINEAPSKASKSNVWLGVYVSGEWWSEKRAGYRTYANNTTTCFDIIKKAAKGKQCVVFSDGDLPKKKTTFTSKFIKN
jgi:hypothetical protein